MGTVKNRNLTFPINAARSPHCCKKLNLLNLIKRILGMLHLQNAEVLSMLKRRDSHLQKVIKDMGRLETFFKQSTFARILDAVLAQIYDVPRKDSIQADLGRRFGETYGPADLLPYLYRRLQELKKRMPISLEVESLELVVAVCQIAFGTLNLDSRSFEEMHKLVIENLSKLPGITEHTVTMMKMNAMTDLDLCPMNDTKLNDAVRYLYGGKSLREVANKWSPYRSVVCWYIWEYQRKRMVKLLDYKYVLKP